MIQREKLLDKCGFKFDGDGLRCVDCPKGTRFTFKDLDAMDDNMFIATMREHEKSHAVGFEKALLEFGDTPKKQETKPRPSKGNTVKTSAKKPTTQEQAPSPKRKQTQIPAKKEPIAAPALPKKLIDAGLGTVLISPKKAFLAAGGTEQQFAKEINFAVQHLMKSDFILNCAKNNPEYLVEAVKNIALTGLTLNPELKLGYLVPRSGKIYFSSSYMGKREIVNRTGHVKDSFAALVYEKDVFKVTKGTSPSIVHEPHPWGDRGELMGGYFVCELSNGSKTFDTMTKERIEEIKKRSESVKAGGMSPWKTDYEEMALKTVYNWGFKFMPKTGLSQDQVTALTVESKLDNDAFEEWSKSQDKKADMFDNDGPASDDDIIQDAKVVG